MTREAHFDRYAESYDEALAQGLAISGEDKHFFARGRVTFLANQLAAVGFQAQTVLDYGCGTGTATPYLLESLNVRKVIGVDISLRSIEVASRTYSSLPAEFLPLESFRPCEQADLVYCNGVFHHIPPAERADAIRCIWQALRPGGYFALWENNPWNPATRYVMSRCPFDDDAITLTPPEARRLVQQGGFTPISTRFLFIFPRALAFLRCLEPPLARVPLGTQYEILCQKVCEPPGTR